LDVSLLVFDIELSEESSGGEETGGIGGGVVGETGGDSESLELEGVGGGFDLISGDGGVDDLADDSLVGSSDNESPLGGVVLVLSLSGKSLSLVVVGLTLSSSSEFDLESLVIGVVLLYLDEGHCRI